MTASLCRCLSYDARLVQPSLYLPVARQLDSRVESLFCAIVETQVKDVALGRLAQPTYLGGLGVRMPPHDSHSAFVGTMHKMSTVIETVSTSLGCPSCMCHSDAAAALEAIGSLQLCGIATHCRAAAVARSRTSSSVGRSLDCSAGGNAACEKNKNVQVRKTSYVIYVRFCL